MFSTILRKAICKLIIEEAQVQYLHQAPTPELRGKSIHPDLERPICKWTDHEFNQLALMMDLGTSTVRRLFGCNGNQNQGNLSPRNRVKIAQFLHYDDWEKLETQVLIQLFRKIIDTCQDEMQSSD